MAPVHAAGLCYGQARPVEETLAFGAQALREALPLPRTERLLGDAGHIREQQAGAGLHTDHLDGGDGQGVRQALLLQEGAQVGTVAVDGIGHHPAEGQAGSLGALDHQLAQFGFGAKGDRLGDMGGLPPGRSAHQSSGRYNSRSMRA